MEHTTTIFNSTKKTQHEWRLEDFCDNFDFIDEHQTVTISSGEFKIEKVPDYAFFLKMIVSQRSIKCSLHRCLHTKFTCMSCRLWFKGGNKYLKDQQCTVYNHGKRSEALATIVLESTDLLSKRKNELFPGNNLAVICELRILKGSAKIQPVHTPTPCHSIKEDLEELLQIQSDCDVVFEVDGKDFAAHKLILKARSRVFAAMFEHDMMEKNTNRVQIIDISETTFDLLLHFIYTDTIKTDLDVESGLDLLRAACKYELDSLQNSCETKLLELITTDNAEKMQGIAEYYNLINFIRSIEVFIKSHPKLN